MLDRLGDEDVRGAVIAYRDVLRAHREYLNRLNVYPVPDGDTGTNMSLTLESVVTELEGVTGMADTCKAVSHGSLMGARGNSGVILSQILRGLADGLRDADGADGADGTAVAAGFVKASAGAYDAVMRPVEGTILTVARATVEAVAGVQDGSLVDVLDAGAAAARDALARTPDLLPVLAEAGVVDAGGAGFVLLLDALLYVAADRPLPEPPAVPAHVAGVAAETGGDGHGDDSDLRYEVMFLLEAPDDDIPGFKQAWAGMGDSIVVTGGDGLWNCHIHTNDVGRSIEAGIDAGRPRKIEVTDLTDMIEKERLVRSGHGDACAGHHAEPTGATEAAPRTTAVVAVGTGEGIERILRSLGAASVVSGGQSMNPSTRDILAAVEAVGAEEVVVLPNNGNIILVAKQVDYLTAKTVRVVETRSVAEGFAALLGYDPAGDAGGNAKAMAESAASVVTGEVTRAVKDARTAAGPCREGDYLGVAPDGIRVVAPTAVEAACGLLDAVVEEHHEMVTIIEGAPASAADTAAIVEWLHRHRPHAAPEVHPGGQPLAAYLFSVE